MEVKVLGSGSKGNCYIIQEGKEKLILELGLSFNKIKQDLRYDLRGVKGALVSHSHSDHSKGVLKALESSIDVYMSDETIDELELNKGYRLHSIKPKKQFKIGCFDIMPLEANHDVKCLSFLISTGKDKLLFITDSYYFKYRVPGVNKILIECNYDDNIIEYLLPYEARLLKSHMSLKTCKKTLGRFDLEKCKSIMLIHISDRHGNKEKFKNEIYNFTGIKTYIAEPGEEMEG